MFGVANSGALVGIQGHDMISLNDQMVSLPLNVLIDLCGAGNRGRIDESDDFFMYTYKVKRCPRNRAHDWTECPFAHRGEKARRRDPRKFPYQGEVCPEFKVNGECKKGQNCEFAHGIFEFWLHPSRFRTRMCESGLFCPRKVCFFAHMPAQLRQEGVHNCSRLCRQRGEAASSAPVTAEPAASASSSAGGAGVEEDYNDFNHLGWLEDMVAW